MKHFLININIPLGGDGVIEALLAFGHDALEGAMLWWWV